MSLDNFHHDSHDASHFPDDSPKLASEYVVLRSNSNVDVISYSALMDNTPLLVSHWYSESIKGDREDSARIAETFIQGIPLSG